MSGSLDKTIKLWNPENGKLIRTYKGHGYGIFDIAISSDNVVFASCGGDKQPFYWDVVKGEIIRKFKGHKFQINSIKFDQSCSILATGSNDQTVKIWDCRSRSNNPIQTLEDAKDTVTVVSITDNEIFSGSADGSIRTYDLRMGQLRIDDLSLTICSLDISSDGQILLVGTGSSKLLLLDKEDGTLYHEYTGHTNRDCMIDARFFNKDSLILSGSETGEICVWELEDSPLLLKFKAHLDTVTRLKCSPTGTNFVTASQDRSIKSWKLSDTKN